MPTYRSINVSLHSQFGIETIPEYYPPPPSPSSINSHSATSSPTDPTVSPTIPLLTDDNHSTTNVHIPLLPGSQFWLSYSVSPPVPEGHFFLFKLYIDGKRVVSWATGREEGWEGKTVCALFGRAEGEGGVEKRVFCFGSGEAGEGDGNGVLEIRVHRADKRRRVGREMWSFEEMGLDAKCGDMRLVSAGRAGSEQPERFYKFQLIDPVDQPFATFRYHCRSWAQLKAMGLLDHQYWDGSEQDLSVIEPGANSTTGTESGSVVHHEPEDVLKKQGDGISAHDWASAVETSSNSNGQTSAPPDTIYFQRPSSNRDSIASGAYVPRGAPATEVSTGSPPSLRRRSRKDIHRLSFPPSINLAVPKPEPWSLPLPQKSDSSTAYRPHPAYPVEERTVRTPSPVKSVRDGITTPPPGRRGVVGVGAGLMGVIQSTWKRSISAAQAQKKGEVGEGPRSVSY